MDSHHLVRAFGTAVGLDLVPDADGVAVLSVADDVVLQFECAPDGRHLAVAGVIGPLPSRSPDVLIALLESNYGGAATDGGAVALRPLGGDVVLTRRFAAEATDPAGLERAMEGFIRTLRFWHGYLPRLAAGAIGSIAAPPDDPGPVIWG